MKHQTTLRFIDAIARAGSIRRAADAMNITPSALNRRLLAVEDELDAPLFERLAVGVRLSAAGELFVAHARRQMADMERVRSHIEDMKGVRRGHVAFGYDHALVAEGFGDALHRYRGQHPDVSFAIERAGRDDIVRGLAEYRFDLAGIVQGAPAANLTVLATAPLAIAAVMHPTHPLAHEATVGFAQLLAHPLVLPRHGSLRHLLDAAARRQDYELRPILQCELAFAGPTIAEGHAVGFQINTATRTETVLAGTRIVPLDSRDVPQPTLHLVQLRGRPLSVAAGRFADMLTQRFARYSGEI